MNQEYRLDREYSIAEIIQCNLLDKRLQRFVLVAAKHRCAHCGTDQHQCLHGAREQCH